MVPFKLHDQRNLYRNVNTIEEFEKEVRNKEPEWFMEPTQLRKSMKPGQKLNQAALQKAEAFGIWQRDDSSIKTPIPPGAYPFYSFLMPLLVKQFKNANLGNRIYSLIVNKGLRGSNPFEIKEDFGSNFINNIYEPIASRVRNKFQNAEENEIVGKTIKVLNHEDYLKRMINGAAKPEETDTILDSVAKKEPKKDDDEDFEKPREEKATDKFKRVEEKLKKARISTQGESNKKLLNSIINKYPEADDEEILTTYALASDDSPPTMPITISGQTFTKKELLSILNNMEESIIEILQFELLEEGILSKMKKLISYIRSGKTKEELQKGEFDSPGDEEDFKGMAAQVNRVKERVLKSKTKQVNIGKSLKTFLKELDVPTAKLTTKEDERQLGIKAFDAIINGVQTQGKED